MTDRQSAVDLGIQAARDVQQVVSDIYPGASNVTVRTVNQYPDRWEILDYRAELPDGTTVHKARITIPR